MTRLQRKRRRNLITVCVIFIAAILIIVGVVAHAETKESVGGKQIAVGMPVRSAAEIKAEAAVDHPQPPPPPEYLIYDVPLDDYTKRTLWEACQEWDVPYALALAVCWRETNYQNLVTPYAGETYYGMMAVQLKSAKWYMEQCGVEYLNSEEDRLRVACCILSTHIKNTGSIWEALCLYSSNESGWYARDVLAKMEEISGKKIYF